MGLNWTAGALGFIGGASGTYAEQQKKQREWSLEQAAAQADMDRKQHFETVMGGVKNQQALDFNKQQTLQQAELYNDPTVAASRTAEDARAVGLARDTAMAGAEGELSVQTGALGQKKVAQDIKRAQDIAVAELGIKDAATQKKLTEAYAAIDSKPGASDTEKEMLKWRARATALGVPVTKDANITPDNYLKARELAIKQVGDIDEGTAVKVLMDMNPERYTNVKKYAAKQILTDLLVNSSITAMTPVTRSGKTVAPQDVVEELSLLSPEAQKKQLNVMKARDPEMYSKVLPLVMVPAVSPTPSEKPQIEAGQRAVPGPPVETGALSRTNPLMTLFNKGQSMTPEERQAAKDARKQKMQQSFLR